MRVQKITIKEFSSLNNPIPQIPSKTSINRLYFLQFIPSSSHPPKKFTVTSSTESLNLTIIVRRREMELLYRNSSCCHGIRNREAVMGMENLLTFPECVCEFVTWYKWQGSRLIFKDLLANDWWRFLNGVLCVSEGLLLCNNELWRTYLII